jgi:hypothetical protein
MKIESLVKRLCKKQRFLLRALVNEPLAVDGATSAEMTTESLKKLGLVESSHGNFLPTSGINCR